LPPRALFGYVFVKTVPENAMASSSRTLLIAVTAALAGALGGFAATVAADQPLMQSALTHLEAAERDLDKATNDKGGHRVEALRLVRAAQKEVRKGIKFDRRH
jgi:hypothetical protein